jgi:hypothetical protein
VQFVDNLLRRDTDSTHEKRRLLFDYDINELGKLAFSIIILLAKSAKKKPLASRTLNTYIGLPSRATDSRNQQIDSKGGILILKSIFNLLDLILCISPPPKPLMKCTHLPPENLRRVPKTTNHTQATSISNSNCKLRTSGDIHPSEDDRMPDPK